MLQRPSIVKSRGYTTSIKQRIADTIYKRLFNTILTVGRASLSDTPFEADDVAGDALVNYEADALAAGVNCRLCSRTDDCCC